MSSLFTDHLIVVHDQHVVWATRRSWKRALIWHEQASGDVLEACASLLKHAPRGRFRQLDRVTVLFGFPHVSYTDLPWQEGLYSDADWQSYARALFTERFGLRFDTWPLVIERARFGATRLAAAVRGELCEDMRRLLRAAGMRLHHCLPLAMAVAQHHWWTLPADCVLAVPETHAITCLYRQADAWRAACSLRVNEQFALNNNLAAAQLLSGRSADTILVADYPGVYGRDASLPGIRWLGRVHAWQRAS